LGDIFGLEDAEFVLLGDGVGAGVEDGGIHFAWVDGTEADLVGFFFDRGGGDEAMQGEFGGHIGWATQGVATLAGYGVDDYHQTAFALAHSGQNGLQHVKSGIEVAVEHGFPAFGRQFGQGALFDVGAGVGDKEVDFAQMFGGG